MSHIALRRDGKSPAEQVVPFPPTTEELEQRIRERAYELWEQRGCPMGSDQDDWFHAERESRAGRQVRKVA
jgi:hypothetical protein